jgi:hypothetical protein
VTRDQIEAVVRSRPPGQLIGEALVAAGLVSLDDLTDALSRQSSELTYDVLRGRSVGSRSQREPFSVEAEAAKLGLGISGLVLEGFRRVDEWRLMEGTINFDQVVVDRSGDARRRGLGEAHAERAARARGVDGARPWARW